MRLKNKLHEKGQIFSIDALVALIIATLVLGLTIQIIETQSYNLKQEQVFNELKTVGHNAANLLVSLPDISCDLISEDGTGLTLLNNCIDADKLKNIEKGKLGIPPNYKCRIKLQGAQMNACKDNDTHAQNIYSEKRIILLHKGALEKKDISDCSNDPNNCKLKNEKNLAEVSVWK
ncbi:MAG: hypothetical protein AABW72_01990 [archaeon]